MDQGTGMRRLRPSPAMIVALVALVFSMSGTALAATHLVSGDKLIKVASLSGNRLRSKTVTGTQIKASTLPVVPHAQRADTAGSATYATTAGSATPSGAAGGALSGKYPNPGLAAGAVTDSALSPSGADAVAEAGGLVTVDSMGTITVPASFDRLASGAIVVTRARTGVYDVTIPGLSFSENSDIALVTLVDGGTSFASVGSDSGNLRVYIYDNLFDSSDLSDAGFSFVVYD